MKYKFILTWFAVTIWTVFIWTLGGNYFSSESTSHVIRPLLEYFLPKLLTPRVELIHFFIRKTFHFFEYGVLALLVVRALLITWRLSWPRAATVTVSLALALALADEGRQAISKVRGGNLTDVILDFAGASATLGMLHLLPSHLRELLLCPGKKKQTTK